MYEDDTVEDNFLHDLQKKFDDLPEEFRTSWYQLIEDQGNDHYVMLQMLPVVLAAQMVDHWYWERDATIVEFNDRENEAFGRVLQVLHDTIVDYKIAVKEAEDARCQ